MSSGPDSAVYPTPAVGFSFPSSVYCLPPPSSFFSNCGSLSCSAAPKREDAVRAAYTFLPSPVSPCLPRADGRLCFCAEYILGTVHKAKGLEFDTVHVLDDFVKVPCAKHNLAQLPHFRVGEQKESSLWGCLAFSGMVWPLGRILLEQKGPPGPKFVILRLVFRRTELPGPTSVRLLQGQVCLSRLGFSPSDRSSKS